jgi:hypothetical protein
MDRETLTDSATMPARGPVGHPVLQAALVGLVTVACLAGLALASGLIQIPCTDSFAQEQKGPAGSARAVFNKLNLFTGWEKPAVVLVLSGEMHGYLQPCGCSEPQKGGLSRRYNVIEGLKAQGWPVVAVDLGDVAQELTSTKKGVGEPQALIKYRYAMTALKMMGYSAVGVGELEMRRWLPNIIGEFALNNNGPADPKILAANIKRNQEFQDYIFDAALGSPTANAPKVGVVSLIAPSVEKEFHKSKLPLPEFDPKTPEVLYKALKRLAGQGAALNVLLYQGKREEAENCAKAWEKARTDPKNKSLAIPHLDVILRLSDDSEPPAVPDTVGSTMIVQVGHKGRFIGVVGAFPKNGQPGYDLRYQLVALVPEFQTPDAEAKNNKVMELMEKYAKEVKDGNFLAKYKQTKHPTQLADNNATYVGSDACKNCHKEAFKIWQGSKHAGAYDIGLVVKAKNPALRQFDGECVVCHTVGFDYETGYRDQATTKFLSNVGCESCHGPCSEHVAKPRDPKIHLLINPDKYRGQGKEPANSHKVRMLRIADKCILCHDLDNDVNWNFDQRWPEVIHMNPPAAGQAPPAKK